MATTMSSSLSPMLLLFLFLSTSVPWRASSFAFPSPPRTNQYIDRPRHYNRQGLTPRPASILQLQILRLNAVPSDTDTDTPEGNNSNVTDGSNSNNAFKNLFQQLKSGNAKNGDNSNNPLKEFFSQLKSNNIAKSSGNAKGSSSSNNNNIFKLPERAYQVYTEYFDRLWNETSVSQREKMSRQKAASAVRTLQSVLRNGDEYRDSHVAASGSSSTSKDLIEACDAWLAENQVVSTTTPTKKKSAAATTSDEDTEQQQEKQLSVHKNDESSSKATALNNNDDSTKTAKKKKPRRSILFGALMGAAVACWVFSGNYIFTGLFTLMTILGQLEYYRMIMGTGVYPARRISIVGACSMFVTALVAPSLHQICLPIFGMMTMVWFLTMKRNVTTIPEIATTFTGMFYLGYAPSFWVRIRLLGGMREPTRLAGLVAPALRWLGHRAETKLPKYLPKFVHLPITTGAIFIFWTWLSLAFSDVGAYFVGKSFGKTKLGAVAPAAGATSPNKTVEGVVGGCAVAAGLSIIGAWVQRWPYWWLTGAVHGIMLGLLGLIGDLTASMLKRDSGLKDFGDLIPEHGGIMDRVDSYIWTAPYSWLVCAYIIPALKTMVR